MTGGSEKGEPFGCPSGRTGPPDLRCRPQPDVPVRRRAEFVAVSPDRNVTVGPSPTDRTPPAGGAGGALARFGRTVAGLPSATLLAVQMLGVLIYPFINVDRGTTHSGPGGLLLGAFGVVVLLLAVRTVRSTSGSVAVAVALGVPALVLAGVEAFVASDGVVIAAALVHAAFYFVTAFALIRYMFSDLRVTADELWATGAAFTVIAWGFAHLYMATQVIWPGSFIAAVDSELPRTWMEMLFLSFTTLTSTGLSDIVPVLPNARSFLMVEQVVGMLYLALVVARLASLAARREGDAPAGK